MYILKAPNINGVNITVTSTATDVFNLINTAAGTTGNNAGYPVDANGVDIMPENGDVRFTLDDTVPTATTGFLIKSGSVLFLRGIPLKKLRLIRAGGSNVKCSIQIGRCERGEASSLSTGLPFLSAAPVSGELQGVTSATQMPSVAAKMVKFKARGSNAGYAYVGREGVTKPDGTTDATTGWELAAGEESPWCVCQNLNEFYRICDNVGDGLVYFVQN